MNRKTLYLFRPRDFKGNSCIGARGGRSFHSNEFSFTVFVLRWFVSIVTYSIRPLKGSWRQNSLVSYDPLNSYWYLNGFLTCTGVKTDIDLEFYPYLISYHRRKADRPRILKIIERETSIYHFWDFSRRIYTEIMYFAHSKNGISWICNRPRTYIFE